MITADAFIILIAILELWITKIVISFYQALSVVPPHRKELLRYADIPVQYIYS